MIMSKMTFAVRLSEAVVCGNETYHELSFWIPCVDRQSGQPALFLPFLFPDSFSAIATGREVYGFFKTPASFQVTGKGKGGDEALMLDPRFSASAVGFRKFGRDETARLYEFLKVEFPAGSGASEIAASESPAPTTGILRDQLAPVLGRLLAGATAAARSLVVAPPPDSALARLIGALSGLAGARLEEGFIGLVNALLDLCPAIFLKQFPSIGDARLAETRSITAASFQLSKLKKVTVWPFTRPPMTYDLHFQNLDSFPLATALGVIPARQDQDLTVVQAHGFSTAIDFSLETGRTMADISNKKQKIAILGGGAGALSAAFGITEVPGWQDQYEITVYQLGWRLGGKGASGRNRTVADRIEEHGLHIWFGYYENAFRAIRTCYAELNRAPNTPLATWDMAFKPHNSIVVQEFVDELRLRDGTVVQERRPHLGGPWQTWYVPFGTTPGTPGDEAPVIAPDPALVFHHLQQMLTQLAAAIELPLPQLDQIDALMATHLGTDGRQALGRPLTALLAALPALPDQAKAFAKTLTDPGENRRWAKRLEEILDLIENFLSFLKEVLTLLLETVASDLAPRLAPAVKALLEPFAQSINSVFRIADLARLAVVIAKGVILDGVLTSGYKSINQYNFTDWLMANGASSALANSAIVRAFYDLYLGFPDGRTTDCEGVGIGGNVSAGELLHSYVLVVACYKGAIMWKMQAGMGDTVFTPLYQALKQRGVKFRFFHKITDLHVKDGAISAIDYAVQATLKAGLTEYNPLYDVRGLACWPSEPNYDQLVQGEALRRRHVDLESSWANWTPPATGTLVRGQDFDQVVLGISVAALPYITEELAAANPGWRAMLDHANTSAVQAMQLWLNVNLEETGWPLTSPVMDAYAEPFNTWAAMDQTLDKENWPQNALPFNIAYFCNNRPGELPKTRAGFEKFIKDNPTYPQQQNAEVENEGRKWLDAYAPYLWPTLTGPDGKGFDWSALVDMENRTGVERLNGQYFRGEVEPTLRYVCNKAGTNQYRLTAGGSGFTNLFLAGDWIDTGSLNLGCVETTVISGLQAARALTNYPVPIARDA